MQKRRPTSPCPIPGCWNRTWAKRNLPVCGNCAQEISSLLNERGQRHWLQMTWEMDTLRGIIKQQTAELRVRKGFVDPPAVRNQEPSSTDGVVYYLRSGGYIKIGWTSDLAKRMRAYSPDSVLLAVEPGTRKDENRRHKMFAAHRTHGREWYAMTPSVMQHIEQTAAKHGAPDPVTFAAKPVEIPQPRPVELVTPRGWTGRRVS